jgi:UDP-4-amino-4,6-dideoxy-N-acetyl-beta-L-altrosamine transaminase
MIPYGRQDITDADIEAVLGVLRSDFLTQGPAIGRFESAMAQSCDAQHAVAVNSATAALHIACQAVGLGPGDWLWTSPNTFVASANCGLFLGASVDFVDVDPHTYNMSPAALRTKLVAAKRTGTLPKIVIPVHFAGQSCRMDEIGELAEEFGFTLIEDASHAVGGSYRGDPIGSCRHSSMTIFSFHPVKIITSGEGGMVLTNSPVLNDALIRLRSHGITRNPEHMSSETHGPWYYQQIELGYNYRMTDLQAALGESQLRRLGEYVRRRHELADRYDVGLSGLPLILPKRESVGISALHLYPIKLLTEARLTRLEFFQRLRDSGIGVNVHYIPVHTQPYYANLGFKQGDFPEAEAYYSQTVSLPLFPALLEQDQDRVIQCVQELIS